MKDGKLEIEQMLEEAAELPLAEPCLEPPRGAVYAGTLPEQLRLLDALWQQKGALLDTLTLMLENAEEHEVEDADLEELQAKIKTAEEDRDYVQFVYRFESARHFGTLGTGHTLHLCKGWRVYRSSGIPWGIIAAAGGVLFGIWGENYLRRR